MRVSNRYSLKAREETKAYVEKLIKNYREKRKELDMISSDIKQFEKILEEEGIEVINFARPQGDKVSTSEVADRTGRAALNYKDFTDERNNEAVLEMVMEYNRAKNELDMLDDCIRKLPTPIRDVMKDRVHDGLSWANLANKHNVSIGMVGKYRRQGIAYISRMFEVRQVLNKCV